MQRCLELSLTGEGHVAPNPMVGAVLVHEGKIIGEGYHRLYGQAHAEVNCVNSVPENLQRFIPHATMYVSLEPCSHYGKTPPCADLIIARRIPRVVIGCVDTFSAVSGRGIRRLQEARVEVTTGVLEKECRTINRRFFTFHEQQRPYIILKWAQSSDGYMAPPDGRPVRISHPYTDRLVHRWRSREAGILIGTHTALQDNPRLTTRLWPGKHPVRLVIDRHLRIPVDFHLHDTEAPTLFFTERTGGDKTVTLDFSRNILPQLLSELHARNIQSVIVEGGRHLLEQFIESGLWDEARVITGEHPLHDGLRAPVLPNASLQESFRVHHDEIAVFQH